MHSHGVIWKIKSKSNFPVSLSLVSAEMNLVGNYRTLRGLQTVNTKGLPSTRMGWNEIWDDRWYEKWWDEMETAESGHIILHTEAKIIGWYSVDSIFSETENTFWATLLACWWPSTWRNGLVWYKSVRYLNCLNGWCQLPKTDLVNNQYPSGWATIWQIQSHISASFNMTGSHNHRSLGFINSLNELGDSGLVPHVM